MLQSSALGAGGLLVSGEVAAASAKPMRPAALGAGLLEFERRVHAAGYEHMSAISLPFAAVPLNFYIRDHEALQKIEIPEALLRLHTIVTSQPQLGVALAEGAVQHAFRYHSRKCPWKIVAPSQIPKKGLRCLVTRELPDRVVTPRYSIDEHELDAGRLGLILVGMYCGIVEECLSKYTAAYTAAAEAGSDLTKGYHDVTLPQLRVACPQQLASDGPQTWFTWEWLAFSLGNGRIGKNRGE